MSVLSRDAEGNYILPVDEREEERDGKKIVLRTVRLTETQILGIVREHRADLIISREQTPGHQADRSGAGLIVTYTIPELQKYLPAVRRFEEGNPEPSDWGELVELATRLQALSKNFKLSKMSRTYIHDWLRFARSIQEVIKFGDKALERYGHSEKFRKALGELGMVDLEVNYPAFALWIRQMLGQVVGDLESRAVDMAHETERIHARTMGEQIRQTIRRPLQSLWRRARRQAPAVGGGGED